MKVRVRILSFIGKGYNRYALRTSVFFTGMSVLVFEVAATRVLAPYFGNTIYTVSSVLSVILAALAWGYRIGGRKADAHPEEQVFYGLILTGGIFAVVSYAASVFLLPILSRVSSIVWGPLIASALFFLVPNVYLGMLSPFAVALEKKREPREGVGSASGDVFFYSTLGSIAGGLLAGFVLIPHFGLPIIMIGVSTLLAMLGLVGSIRSGASFRSILLVLLVIAALVAIIGLYATAYGEEVRYSAEGTYAHITIKDVVLAGRPVRLNMLDNEHSGAMYLDSTDPDDQVFPYTPYYRLYTLFRNNPPVRAFVIGGAASYTVPKALLAREKQIAVDVAEIDPRLPELAHQYFGVPESDRLYSHISDARAFLRTHEERRYDIIFADAFSSYHGMPPHLATREFFTLAHDRLTKDGVFIMNVIGDLEPRERNLVYALMHTFRSVFPQADFFAVSDPHSLRPQNFIFLGMREHALSRAEAYARARESEDPLMVSLEAHWIPVPESFLDTYPILTDAYAPIEYLVAPSFQ